MSSRQSARVLVVGAGVNGSVCAARLALAGVDVALLARGPRLEQVFDEGLVVADPLTGATMRADLPVISRLEPDDLYDYVLVTVRENQIAPLLPALAENCSPNLVFMGNNLAGPGPMIAALDAERVMLGFVFGAGKRDGAVVRAVVPRGARVPFGELDGRVTRRLRRLVSMFRGAGLSARVERKIVDVLATHAITVALIAALVNRHHLDLKALAEDRDSLLAMIDARREAFHALRTLGRRAAPLSVAIFSAAPRSAQAGFYATLLRSRLAEVGLARQVSQAPDEMLALSDELDWLIAEAQIPAPAVERVLHGAPPPLIFSPGAGPLVGPAARYF